MWVPGAKPKMKTHNSDMDGLAIVIRGNKATKNVATGDYVLVENSTISGIADGGYKAAANVSAGTAFTSANLTPLSKGAVTQIGEDVASLNSNMLSYIKPWTRLDVKQSTNTATYNLTGYKEVRFRVQQTIVGNPSRNTAIVLNASELSNNPGNWYFGAYIGANSGFGVCITATDTSAVIVSIGANGTSIISDTNVYLVVEAR